MSAPDRSKGNMARVIAGRVRAAIRKSAGQARRHPRRFVGPLAAGMLATVGAAVCATVCAVGWTWSVGTRRNAESAFERERSELREAIEDARIVATVESHHAWLNAMAETGDASGELANARRAFLTQVETELQRQVEAADQRPHGVLAAERGRLELARLRWREYRQPADAAKLYTAIIGRLAPVAASHTTREERDRLLEAAYHGQFHTILESRGGVELTACLEAWSAHLESTLAHHRGAPWVGHAWTRYAVAQGLVAESRGSPGNETAKRHYRAAVASPPETIREAAARTPLQPITAHRGSWSATWLPTAGETRRVPTKDGDATVSAEQLFFDEWLEDRCEVFGRLARAEFLAGEYEVAVGLQREAVAARVELRNRAATRRRRWLHLGDTFTLGLFLKAAGEMAASRTTLETTLDDALGLVGECPDWREPRRLCREVRDTLAIVYQASGEPSRALDLLVNATVALSALPLDREPLAALDDQAIIREELGKAHAAAGRKSLAWRNSVESLTLRDAIWRRDPRDEAARQLLLQAAQTTLELAVTPAEWRESLSVVDPLILRMDPDGAAQPSEAAVQVVLGHLYLLRGNALQMIHGDAEARVDLVAPIRVSYLRARDLLSEAGQLPPDRARDLDSRIRTCDAVLKKLESKKDAKPAGQTPPARATR